MLPLEEMDEFPRSRLRGKNDLEASRKHNITRYNETCKPIKSFQESDMHCISGFPGEDEKCWHPWQMEGSICKVEPKEDDHGLIMYKNIDTSVGQSGSMIYSIEQPATVVDLLTIDDQKEVKSYTSISILSIFIWWGVLFLIRLIYRAVCRCDCVWQCCGQCFDMCCCCCKRSGLYLLTLYTTLTCMPLMFYFDVNLGWTGWFPAAIVFLFMLPLIGVIFYGWCIVRERRVEKHECTILVDRLPLQELKQRSDESTESLTKPDYSDDDDETIQPYDRGPDGGCKKPNEANERESEVCEKFVPIPFPSKLKKKNGANKREFKVRERFVPIPFPSKSKHYFPNEKDKLSKKTPQGLPMSNSPSSGPDAPECEEQDSEASEELDRVPLWCPVDFEEDCLKGCDLHKERSDYDMELMGNMRSKCALSETLMHIANQDIIRNWFKIGLNLGETFKTASHLLHILNAGIAHKFVMMIHYSRKICWRRVDSASLWPSMLFDSLTKEGPVLELGLEEDESTWNISTRECCHCYSQKRVLNGVMTFVGALTLCSVRSSVLWKAGLHFAAPLQTTVEDTMQITNGGERFMHTGEWKLLEMQNFEDLPVSELILGEDAFNGGSEDEETDEEGEERIRRKLETQKKRGVKKEWEGIQKSKVSEEKKILDDMEWTLEGWLQCESGTRRRVLQKNPLPNNRPDMEPPDSRHERIDHLEVGDDVTAHNYRTAFNDQHGNLIDLGETTTTERYDWIDSERIVQQTSLAQGTFIFDSSGEIVFGSFQHQWTITNDDGDSETIKLRTKSEVYKDDMGRLVRSIYSMEDFDESDHDSDAEILETQKKRGAKKEWEGIQKCNVSEEKKIPDDMEWTLEHWIQGLRESGTRRIMLRKIPLPNNRPDMEPPDSRDEIDYKLFKQISKGQDPWIHGVSQSGDACPDLFVKYRNLFRVKCDPNLMQSSDVKEYCLQPTSTELTICATNMGLNSGSWAGPNARNWVVLLAHLISLMKQISEEFPGESLLKSKHSTKMKNLGNPTELLRKKKAFQKDEDLQQCDASFEIPFGRLFKDIARWRGSLF